MPDVTQLSGVTEAIDELRARVGEARAIYGDTLAVQRLANDVERLSIDASDLGITAAPRTSGSAPRHSTEPKISIDDTPLDPALWVDADDEGIGGFHGSPR